MTLEDAQALAVVATAQLLAALPAVDFAIDVRPHAGRWTVLVSWDAALERDTIRHVLDDPPAGVVLVHRATELR